MRDHVYTYESPEYVQWFLDQLEPMQPFVVIFQKQDGTQRKLTGTLDPNVTTRKESVPIMTDEGWKRFSVNRVLLIERAE